MAGVAAGGDDRQPSSRGPQPPHRMLCQGTADTAALHDGIDRDHIGPVGGGVCCIRRTRVLAVGPRLRNLSRCVDREPSVRASIDRRSPGSVSRPR